MTFLVLGPVLIAAGWIVAALLSPYPFAAAVPFILAQFALTTLLLGLLAVSRKVWKETGPDTTAFVALHGLIYYGFANVVPVFFRDTRPLELKLLMEERIPEAGLAAYAGATLAAIGLVAGAALGARIVLAAAGEIRLRAGENRRIPWLPGASTSAGILAVLVVVVLAGSARFGLDFAVTLSDENVRELGLLDQLLLHGLFWFLPLGPSLAATVYLQARRPRRATTVILVATSVILVAVVAVWRMRSTAMIAAALPFLLLGLTGRIDIRKWFGAVAVLLAVSYAAVTAVRISDLETLVTTSRGRPLDSSEVRDAVARRSGDQTVAGRAFFDFSYRAAGLEPVAALCEAQEKGQLRLQGGRVVVAGFLQSLPARLRPQQDLPLRVKTAPAVLGVFGEGDWVTTFLSEAVLSFGIWATVLYGFAAGLLIALIERLLVLFGSRPLFEGFLILRYAFLLYFVTAGADLATMTALFFKATIGYLAMFVLVGAIVQAVATPRRPA